MRVIIPNVKYVLCTIHERINRFVVKTRIGGEDVFVHINNTGRLREYLVKGKQGFCIPINGKKLKYRLFAVYDRGFGALIDTNLQEKSFETIIVNKYVKWLKPCSILRRNIKMGNVVLDYLLKCGNKLVYTELKSAVLRIDEKYASYPDAPTSRGRRQIEKLIEVSKKGDGSLIVFVAGLPFVTRFKPYAEGDPVIPILLRKALENGVLIKSFNAFFDPVIRGIVLDKEDLKIDI
ncbi:MAG: DNA/RNA nuclease SfsA [Staphylothermus sp.]|nr:DNA/RNA nuclease SfsA [Staphylothermus sp.]